MFVVDMFKAGLWIYEPVQLANKPWRQKRSCVIVSMSSCLCVWQEEWAHHWTTWDCSSRTWSHYFFPLFFLFSVLFVCVCVRVWVCVCVVCACGFMRVAIRINLVLQLMLIGMTFNTHIQACCSQASQTGWNMMVSVSIFSGCPYNISYVSFLSCTYTHRLSRLTGLLYLACCLLAQ